MHVDPALRLVPTSSPSPFYEPSTRTISFGVPDASTPLGRLQWIFSARAFGLESVDQAMEAAADFLPWLMAHEVAHHLRHHYGAPIANDFVEEQVCNEIALAFVREHQRHADTLPRLRATVAAAAQRLASLAPDAVGHEAGYRTTIAEVLVAEGVLSPGRAAELRHLARALGLPIDAMIDGSNLVPRTVVSAAHARRADAQEYFNRRYAAQLFEYHYFGHSWLAAYLARTDTPSLGAALETHVLTAEWERLRTAQTDLVLSAALHHDDEVLAEAAASTMASERGELAVPALLEYLAGSRRREAPRPRVQAGALAELRAFAHRDDVLNEAIEHLRSRDPDVRAEAAAVMIASGGDQAPRGRAVLQDMVMQDLESRYAALDVVRVLRDPALLLELVHALRLLGVRASAPTLRALSVIPTAIVDRDTGAAIRMIAARVARDRDDDVRRSAFACMGAHVAHLDDAALEAAADALDDGSPLVRRQAGDVLRLAGPRSAPLLLRDEGSLRRRVASTVILHEIGHPDAGARSGAVIQELLSHARLLHAVELDGMTTDGALAAERSLLLEGLAEERRELALLACEVACGASRSSSMQLALRGSTAPDAAVRAFSRRLVCESWPEDLAPQPPDLAMLLDERPPDHPSPRPATIDALAARVLSASPGTLLSELASDLATLAKDRRQPSIPQHMLTTVEKLTYLRAVPVFRRVTLESLRAVIEDVVVRHFDAGEHVFVLGDPGDTLYVVVNGRVGIQQDEADGRLVSVAELTSGQYFGEVSLFGESPRSAVATALEPTTLLTLHREPLLALGRRHPELLVEALRVLSTRIQELNADRG